ncbi:nuclear transport factor 2 family protein [Pelagibacterium montanilacus]|uniref:nuclear transport factor 2 family protein n=1 Tax=Pelagibacterium montanilacus TaxID=2185280 RepID=UPI000F8CC06B|nr:nuclear transport factor 2 family protein [Pelagibacterium montanilacus]
MSDTLPTSIENYFAGKNTKDYALAVSGFAPSAVVKDEGEDHVGPDAIRAWMEDTAARYDNRAEIKSTSGHGDHVEVSAEVTGSFPGSPIVLRFTFTLEDDQITRLSIAP